MHWLCQLNLGSLQLWLVALFHVMVVHVCSCQPACHQGGGAGWDLSFLLGLGLGSELSSPVTKCQSAPIATAGCKITPLDITPKALGAGGQSYLRIKTHREGSDEEKKQPSCFPVIYWGKKKKKNPEKKNPGHFCFQSQLPFTLCSIPHLPRPGFNTKLLGCRKHRLISLGQNLS